MFNRVKKAAAGTALAVMAAPALAAGGGSGNAPNFDALTTAIDVSTTTEAMLSVGAVMVGVALVTMGIRKIVRMVRAG